MGRTKQLLPLGDKPVIRYCIESLMHAGVADIVVVLNSADNGIAGSLDDLPLTMAVNDTPGSDMAESVRTGLKSLGKERPVLICLCDHPLVSPGTIRLMVSEHRAFPASIIIPACEGRRGHPVLFPRPVVNEIFSVPTLRDVVRKDPGRVRTLTVRDRGVILDMDTPEDYRIILQQLTKK